MYWKHAGTCPWSSSILAASSASCSKREEKRGAKKNKVSVITCCERGSIHSMLALYSALHPCSIVVVSQHNLALTNKAPITNFYVELKNLKRYKIFFFRHCHYIWIIMGKSVRLQVASSLCGVKNAKRLLFIHTLHSKWGCLLVIVYTRGTSSGEAAGEAAALRMGSLLTPLMSCQHHELLRRRMKWKGVTKKISWKRLGDVWGVWHWCAGRRGEEGQI